MEGSAIHRKTEKGRKEIADRSSGLEGHARRLLILIDGQRTAEELSVYVRAGELDGILDRLLAEGFVEAVGTDARPARVPAANDPVIFAGIKIQAMTEIRGRLGPVADRLVAEIRDCSTPLELRARLRTVEDVLVHLMGKEDGVALARKIGAELTRLVPKGESAARPT